MGFNKRTSYTMMNFIDEHKQEFSEGEYLEICNALNFLHKKAKKTPPPVPTPLLRQSPLEELTSRLKIDDFINQLMLRYHRTLQSKGRIILQDKQQVLLNIRNSLPEPHRQEANELDLQIYKFDINYFMNFLEAIEYLPGDIDKQFAQARDMRMANLKQHILTELDLKEMEKNDNKIQINNLIVRFAKLQVDHENAAYEVDTDDDDDYEIIDLTI